MGGKGELRPAPLRWAPATYGPVVGAVPAVPAGVAADDGDGAGSPSRSRSLLPWLGVALLAYFTVSFALSGLRVLELQTTTWDMGIYQQALWSTAHGGRPFYEAADWETARYGSLLEVHSAFVLYLIVPLYALVPSQFLLLAVQSAVVAAAAVPLYFLGADLSGERSRGLLGAVVYLAYAPVLTSNLYDFHIEAFLPLGLFTVLWLGHRQRYGLALLAAVAVCATMEFGPVLLAAVGLFFLLPDAAELAGGRAALRRIFGRRGRPGSDTGPPAPAADPGDRRRLRRYFALGLLALGAVAYGLLYVLRIDLLPWWWSLPTPVTGGYVVGLTPSALGLSLGNLPIGLAAKVGGWLVALALLGFVPLLAPRALVLAAPWAAFSLLSASPNYVTPGFQYGFFVAAGLMPAFLFGLGRLDPWIAAARASFGLPARPPSGRRPVPAGPGRRGRRRRSPSFLPTAVAVALLVVVNGLATPADPYLQAQGPASAFRISYAVTPGFAAAERLAGLVPAGATVLASDNLFPLVANDRNAYSFSWVPAYFLHLPFDRARLPEFLFLAENRTSAVPVWIGADLYNTSDYGLRAIAAATPVGAALLFEYHFTGSPLELGVPASVPRFYDGSALAPGPAAYLADDPASPGGVVLESVPGAAGALWSAPGTTLAAGWWTVTLALSGAAIAPGPAPEGPVLEVTSSAYAHGLFVDRPLTLPDLGAPGGYLLSFSVLLTEPVIQFTVDGTLLAPGAEVRLASLEIAPGEG